MQPIDGLYVYDGKTFTLFLINEAPNGFLSRNAKVERMLEDNEGNIWFGARVNEGGVFCYDGKKSIINFKLKPTTVENAIRNWGWPQMQDKNGNIWFSNWDGAYRYDGKKFTSFTKNDGLSGTGLVAKIIEDKKGIIWLGGDGLSRYDGNSFTSFRDGLINPGVLSLFEEKSGNIWVGTREAGFYLFDGKKFINYSDKNDSMKRRQYHKETNISTNLKNEESLFTFSVFSFLSFPCKGQDTHTKQLEFLIPLTHKVILFLLH